MAARLRTLLGGTLVLFLGACQTLDSRVWNLRQVHELDGSPSRTGVLRNGVQLFLSNALRQIPLDGPELFDPEAETIDDPEGLCLKHLIGLAEYDSDDPRARAYQVEFFSWLGSNDRSILSRERCLLELGRLGRELGVKEPRLLPPDSTPADAATIGREITELLRALGPALRGDANMIDRPGLRETCERIEGLEYDLEGGRRFVTAINLLRERLGFGRAGVERLVETHQFLMRTCIELSLAQSLEDPSPLVRSAAVVSCAQLSRTADARLVMAALGDPEAIVVQRGLEILQRYGAPTFPEDLAPEDRERAEDSLLRGMVQLSQSIEDPISVAACKALGKVTGEGRSLRPERWARWWDDRQAVEASVSEESLP